MITLKTTHEDLLYLFKKDIILMTLDDWKLTTIIGSDSKNYLQNQITININELKEDNHRLCAHCNVNGKVWSSLRLFKFKENNYMYLQRKSVAHHQIKELKKYSIFSNINIFNETKIKLLGITGKRAKEKLKQYFSIIPNKNFPIYRQNNTIILWFNDPCERFLLIIKNVDFTLQKLLTLTKTINNSNMWLALDISSKHPIIDKKMSGKFFPQSLNLENLDGLDFKKGCYYGQETIAKIHFKKLNQYNLYWLIATSDQTIHIGEIIESENKNKWYRIGHVLAVAKINKKIKWIQAVLKIETKKHNKIRIKNNINSNLYIQS
ncbi:MAG: tRNA-modifying protein YgfZ [Buchnera aphidicola (Meitanaphis elongallis)]